MSIPADRLVAEALAKSGLLWLSCPAGASPCWHASVDGVAYVVTGPGEQTVPLAAGPTDVIVRAKDSRARLASFTAEASVVAIEDDDWEPAAQALRTRRLNAPAGDLVARWRGEATIWRLVPDLATVLVRGELLEAPSADGDNPPADRPVDTPQAPRDESDDPGAAAKVTP